eukprot:726816_1
MSSPKLSRNDDSRSSQSSHDSEPSQSVSDSRSSKVDNDFELNQRPCEHNLCGDCRGRYIDDDGEEFCPVCVGDRFQTANLDSATYFRLRHLQSSFPRYISGSLIRKWSGFQVDEESGQTEWFFGGDFSEDPEYIEGL